MDRTFALDHMLKSLEKILDGDPREHVHATRVVIRDAAFTVLDRMCRRALDAGSLPCSISDSPGSGRAWLPRRPAHHFVRHRATG